MKAFFPTFIIVAISLCFIFSCSSNEIGYSKDVSQETIYAIYSIDANEGDNSVSYRAEFRFAGENGTTLVLTKPAAVTFDENELKVDSSDFAGAFYESSALLENFTGNHKWVYNDIDGKEHKELFNFQPLTYKNIFPAQIKKKDIIIELSGVTNGDVVNYEINDTASNTNSITVTDTIRNNSIRLKSKDLQTLSNGPVTFNLYQNKTLPLQNPTKEGGVLRIAYSFKQRESILTD